VIGMLWILVIVGLGLWVTEDRTWGSIRLLLPRARAPNGSLRAFE
jgi:hypothetical protein